MNEFVIAKGEFGSVTMWDGMILSRFIPLRVWMHLIRFNVCLQGLRKMEWTTNSTTVSNNNGPQLSS
jgi:hypothetical protein